MSLGRPGPFVAVSTVLAISVPREQNLLIAWPPRIPALIGPSLMVLAIALRSWAAVSLGRFYTRTLCSATDQPVIRTGPYRVVRYAASEIVRCCNRLPGVGERFRGTGTTSTGGPYFAIIGCLPAPRSGSRWPDRGGGGQWRARRARRARPC